MRKVEDDPVARTIAENKLADLLELNHSAGERDADVAAARGVLGEFKAVELETAVSRVAGADIKLRRLVITGAWEVDPGQ